MLASLMHQRPKLGKALLVAVHVAAVLSFSTTSPNSGWMLGSQRRTPQMHGRCHQQTPGGHCVVGGETGHLLF